MEEQQTLQLMLTGDLVLAGPNPDFYFEKAYETLRTADVLVGQVEWPHTTRGNTSGLDAEMPSPGADPENLAALARAGFDVGTVVGNHAFDQGHYGVEDTLEGLRKAGIQSAGAGLDIEEARQPAIVERNGVRMGFLGYNCVGPSTTWASASKAGSAYIEVLTHYQLRYSSPGGVPETFTFAVPDDIDQMQRDISDLRERVDVICVSFHKGVFPSGPGKLGMYERPLVHSAIDAGADIVIGHHQTDLKPVEIYRGRPIFHGVGYFVRAMGTAEAVTDPRLKRLYDRRKLFSRSEFDLLSKKLFDEVYGLREQMVPVCTVTSGGVIKAGFIPFMANDSKQPEPVGLSETGRSIAEKIEGYSLDAGTIDRKFTYENDRVTFLDTNDS